MRVENQRFIDNKCSTLVEDAGDAGPIKRRYFVVVAVFSGNGYIKLPNRRLKRLYTYCQKGVLTCGQNVQEGMAS